MPELNVERKKNLDTPDRPDTRPGQWPRWGEVFGMSPFALSRRFSDEMDRFFTRHFWTEHQAGDGDSWWPSVDVFERGGSMVIRADLPGLAREDIRVEVTDRDVRIHGERKREVEDSHRGFYRSERSYGSFSR